ncbi:MAG: DUF5706 domain-containing protein [Novosphingobium sp.]|nr:DUF5706 domain-containing protein [Novosphingobium sp.]
MEKQGVQQDRGADVVPIDPTVTSAPTAPAATPSMPSPTGFSNHAIHLVRTSMQMNLALSQMADQKASILMGATFVVFTIAVGQARGGGDIPYSLAVLALFAFLSALFAVFAVLPSIRPPKQNVSQLNKLFFGHFTQMTEQDWADAVVDDLRADETVFRAMLHDVYQNGQVLQGKKYKYLGRAYRIFIVGLTLTLATFVAESFNLL